jgi:hypothetical protein
MSAFGIRPATAVPVAGRMWFSAHGSPETIYTQINEPAR